MEVMRIVVSNFFWGQYFTELVMDEGNQKGKLRRCLWRRYRMDLADPPTALNLRL